MSLTNASCESQYIATIVPPHSNISVHFVTIISNGSNADLHVRKSNCIFVNILWLELKIESLMIDSILLQAMLVIHQDIPNYNTQINMQACAFVRRIFTYFNSKL